MAGRIAERIVFDDISSGAKSDIKYASDIARKMVCEWGMSDSMGPLAYGEHEEHIFLGREIDKHQNYSEETARNIDREIRKVVDEAEAKAMQILTDNRDKLDAIGEALMTYEVIDGNEVNIIINGGKIERETDKEDKTDKTNGTDGTDGTDKE